MAFDELEHGLTHDAADAPTIPVAGELPGGGAIALDTGAHPARYAPGDRLGAGGMAEVRIGIDALIGREVAVKLMHADRQHDLDAERRFLREARIQGQLEHPAIVPVHDLGRTIEGRTYFTMKRVRGQTLAAILGGLAAGTPAIAQRYSRRKLLTAFVTVCQAVELAHRRGVIHRDLKPANIMLGDFGEVYVLDWGIARVGASSEPGITPSFDPPERPAATSDGAIVGTPGYMAPEQIEGRVDQLGAAADVYALGAILFEILTHQPLHPVRDTTAALASTLAGVDARPSTRVLGDIPPELDAACVGATALRASQRIPSARALSDAVERYLDGDRDLELRRRLGETHASAAAATAVTALATDDEHARSRAMQEVGRALAMDPDNVAARTTMIQLLTTPPRHVPRGAREALDASALEQQRLAAKMGIFAYLGWLLAIPAALWMGVANWTLFAVFSLVHVIAFASCVWGARATRVGGVPLAVTTVACWAATAAVGLTFGPLILVPTVAAATMTTFLLHPRPISRALLIVLFCAVVVVPVALEAIGAIPASYRFTSGTMEVLPRLVYHPAAAAVIALSIASLATLLSLATAVWKIRALLTEAEERVELSAWQLRQMVPRAPAPGERAA
ncbi:MAG: serine/threonine protein kinase [Deltaproteobacteria bacterium]|nr:serine/threonine protein kinase [Deltaproteobacteria bacterium]